MTIATRITEADLVGTPITGLLAGANLRTPCGQRRVENLRPGDLVVTRDSGLQPVRLIWTHSVCAADVAANPGLAPVWLGPRAIGPMMPQRGLRLAPGHRVLIPGWRLVDQADTAACLVAAHEISGSTDAAYVDRSEDNFVLYNIVFDTHQIFCANGLPVESFHVSREARASLQPDVRAELDRVFPDLGTLPQDPPRAAYPLVDQVQYAPEYA
ncbi:MAG: Hint domain-containing protein [Pseudomonadota bacterium]